MQESRTDSTYLIFDVDKMLGFQNCINVRVGDGMLRAMARGPATAANFRLAMDDDRVDPNRAVLPASELNFQFVL